MRASARELALIDDQIFVADWPALEIALQDFARAGRVTRLRGKRRAGDMRRHAMMRHAAPRMVLRRWLREPDIARIAGKLTAFERPHDGIAVADFSARRVHDISAALHLGNHSVVEEMLGLRMQRTIDGDDIADLDHVLDVWMPGQIEFFFHRLRQPVAVIIVQMHIEGFQAFQHGKANAAGGDRADMHAFDVIGTLDAIGDVPAALHHPLIGRNVIANERQDHHDHVLGNADRIAVGDFGDSNLVVHRRLKIGVIGTNAGGDNKLQFGALAIRSAVR